MEDIGKELTRLKEHIKTREAREPVPKEIKNEVSRLLEKVETTLKDLPRSDTVETSQKLETLSRSIRNLRTSMENSREFSELQDRVLKETAQIKELVRDSDIPNKKEAEALTAKLTEAAEKIANLQGPEQLQEMRRIIREEIQPNLTELKEVVGEAVELAVPASDDSQRITEANHRIDNLLQAVAIVLPEAPAQPVELTLPQAPARPVELNPPQPYSQSSSQSSVQTVSVSDDLAALSRFRTLKTTPDPPPQVHELKEDAVKEIARLKALVENLDTPNKKEIEAQVAKLSEAAEKIQNLKGPEAEQMQQLRKIIAEEVRPNLNELRDVVNREAQAMASDTLARQQVEAVKQQIETLEKVAEITLQPPPESPPPEKVEVLMERVEMALSQVARPDAPPPSPPPEPVRPELNLRVEIADELVKLERSMAPVPQREPLPEDVKPRVEQMMERVDTTLRELPEAYKTETSERLEPLFKELRHFRISLDVQRDFQELKDRLVQDIVRLKALAEELDIPARKEIETQIAKLTEAAEKIGRLKGPEQLPELRRIAAEEINPNMKELRNTLRQALESTSTGNESQARPSNETQQQISNEAQQRIAEMLQRVDQIQRDIDINLPRLPEVPPPAVDIDAMIKPVETALTELTQMAEAAPADGQGPRFSESVQNIYENIKTALRLLQNNLRVSGGQLEIPEEIRQVFENLQSDLKAAEATDMVMEQLTNLRDLIQKADLPIEKVVHEVVESLNDIIAKIGDLREGSRFAEIRELVQKQLGPQLKMLGDVFGSERLMGALELRDQVAAESIRTAVRQLQGGIESAFVRGESTGTSADLAQLTEFTGKLASLSNAASGQAGAIKTPESIANLSQNIAELLSRLPENASSLNSETAIPAKIRSLLSTLQNHFEPLDIGQDAMKLVPKLKSFVEDSGVFFEKKVSDLITKLSEASSRIQSVQSLDQLPEIRSIIDNDMKPNLLQLRELLNNNQLASQLGDARSLDTIRGAVEELLSNIGSQQERAVDNQPNPTPQFFSFHVPIKGEETAELKVFYNKGRKKDSPEEFKMSLFLDMGKLGEVRSDFFHFKEDLSVTFYVRDDKVKSFMEENAHELEEALAPMFSNLSLSFMVSAPRSGEGGEAEEIVQQIISDKEVDVKI